MNEFRGDGNPLQFPWYSAAFEGLGENLRGEILEIGCGRGDFAIWLAGIAETHE